MAPSPLKLSALVSFLDGGVSLVGSGEVVARGLAEDSRRVTPGDVFVVRRGHRVDGAGFARAAIERGAVALLVESGVDVPGDVPRLEAPDLPLAFGLAAEAFAGFPGRALRTVAITGTNGKTTTASLVADALGALGRTVAKLGTLGFFVGAERVFDTLTTPAPLELSRALAIAVERGATDCVLEASSHALDQGRLLGVPIEVGAFLNLTQDHLDYHGTMDRYREAKEKLFFGHRPRHSVVCAASAEGRDLARRLPGCLTVGERTDETPALLAEDVHLDARGIRARVRLESESADLTSPLVGRHNLENLLVALGCLTRLGFPLGEASRALGRAGAVAGRLERCDGAGDDVSVFVDYAHTPDALERVLRAVRAVAGAEVVVVFGCGGDRDPAKRPLMGAAAATMADVVWVTSDNPRSEDPRAIVSAILPGLAGRTDVVIELDRSVAIARAIVEAPSGSTIVIAGKGHEDYQIVGSETREFDDRVHARSALARRRQARFGSHPERY